VIRRLAMCLTVMVVLFTIVPRAGAADLTGTWSGYWVDCNSGHRGPLRATFRKCDDGRYQVVFTGRFWKIFPFRYSVVLNVTGREDDSLSLTGESRLGILFGTFRYTARASSTDFVADYNSRRYQGQFVLERRCP
jgi:hypothetical protein